MMNSYTLDNNSIEIEILNDDSIIIFNQVNDKILQLSNNEFEIIKRYSTNNNIIDCFNYFREDLDIENPDIIFDIISRAKKMDLLKINLNLDNKTVSNFDLKINYFFYFLKGYFAIDFIKLKKKNIYQYLSIDISEKVRPKIIILILIVLLSSLILISYFSSNADIFIKYFLSFPIFILFSTFLHEFAHLYTYKRLGGIKGRIGFGLLFRFYPICYCYNFLIIRFSKLEKILISSSGIIIDCILLWFLYLFKVDQYYLFITIYRIFYNINPLMFGTDGFYIFKDLFDFSPMYLTKKKASIFIIKLLRGNFEFKYLFSLFLFLSVSIANIVLYLLIIALYLYYGIYNQ